jgi:hypothetical protein
MKRIVFLFASLMFFASVAHAQPITKWTARTYNVGAPSPVVGPIDLLAANQTCNVDPATVVPTPTNPLKLVWDDTANPGKVCVYADPGNGPLLATAYGGNYETTLTATNSAGTSLESARAPFTHPGVAPSAPTGVKPGK